MKPLLIIILSLSYLTGEGQTRLTDSLNQKRVVVQGGQITEMLTGNGLVKPTTKKYDTVKIVIMFSDTGRYINVEPVDWMRGYEVFKLIPAHIVPAHREGDAIYLDKEVPDEWEHLKYLDENHKPLSKSIIVWQVK